MHGSGLVVTFATGWLAKIPHPGCDSLNPHLCMPAVLTVHSLLARLTYTCQCGHPSLQNILYSM